MISNRIIICNCVTALTICGTAKAETAHCRLTHQDGDAAYYSLGLNRGINVTTATVRLNLPYVNGEPQNVPVYVDYKIAGDTTAYDYEVQLDVRSDKTCRNNISVSGKLYNNLIMPYNGLMIEYPSTGGKISMVNGRIKIEMGQHTTEACGGWRLHAILRSTELNGTVDVPLPPSYTDRELTHAISPISIALRAGNDYSQNTGVVYSKCDVFARQLTISSTPSIIQYPNTRPDSVTAPEMVTVSVTSVPVVTSAIISVSDADDVFSSGTSNDRFVIKEGTRNLSLDTQYRVAIPAVLSVGLRGQGTAGYEEKHLKIQLSVP
ncbi:hypothetical protein EJH27_01535 [Salmonella enterica subsp. enterica serovar Virchow]|nr:hypothetical protein [Salmonella enterica subsp. enterica serovar Virchow]